MKMEHVAGKKKGDIMLYALSTCVWCKKTKAFLSELGIEYSYVFVDLLNEVEKKEVMEVVAVWNPECSFPTVVINNESCVVGFRPDEIKEKLAK
jgi:glutaredoxin